MKLDDLLFHADALASLKADVRALKSSAGPWQKVAGMVIAGVMALALGYAWGQIFPIIKNIWTSSFVLFAAGWSLLLLALFYTVIDVLSWKTWSFFFVVIGMNAITIYVAQRVIDFNKIATFFLGGVIKFSGDFGTVLTCWYNSAHRDHIHVDNSTAVRPLRTVRSDTTLVQASCNLLNGERLAIDGQWGSLTEAAYNRLRARFNMNGFNPKANTSHALYFLEFVVKHGFANRPAGTFRH